MLLAATLSGVTSSMFGPPFPQTTPGSPTELSNFSWVAGMVLVVLAIALSVFGIAFLVIGIAGVVLFRVFPVGMCQRCGYDLRGQVERRCPECGTAF